MAELTSATLREILAPTTDVTPLVLLTLSHPDMGEPARLVLNTSNVWSRAKEYLAAYFKVDLPLDSGDELASSSLEADNVDRSMIETIRTLTSPPQVTLEVVMDSDPDTVELGPFDFDLKDAEYGVLTIRGQLAYEDILNEGFPTGSYNPRDFPGLFS